MQRMDCIDYAIPALLGPCNHPNMSTCAWLSAYILDFYINYLGHVLVNTDGLYCRKALFNFYVRQMPKYPLQEPLHDCHPITNLQELDSQAMVETCRVYVRFCKGD